MSGSGPAPPESGVRWRYGTEESRLLSALAYAFPSALGGTLLLVVAFLVWRVVSQPGDLGVVLVFGVFFVVASLARLLLPTIPDQSGRLVAERYSRRGLGLGSVLGAGVLLAGAKGHPAAPFAVFVGSMALHVLVSVFPAEGRVEPADGTLVVGGSEVPLPSLRGYRAFAIADIVVCWLSYARGVPGAPRLLVVPRTSFDPVRSVLSDAADRPLEAGTPIDVPERAVAVAFGVGLIAVGPAFWMLLPPGDSSVLVGYAGAVFGLFGAIFLWYGTKR